tara:strand:- start:43 stop:1656 length:1614 start_codon:yes stop_codon:yes gene_type:complete
MKKGILLALLITYSLAVFSQKDTKTLVTINGDKTTVADFKRIYEKNLNAIDNDEGKDVEKNLQLFINYKLKVKEAYQLKLDTLKSYKREIETYRNQLTAPYLQDKDFLETLIKQAYDRTKTELRGSHILIKFPRNYKPEDSLTLYNKIIKARNRILAGEAFDIVAKEMSEDQSAADNGGDLGYFSAFKMVYDFEDAAYKTALGKVSQPFKTRFGYHIVQNTGSRTSRGERQVAHILVTDTTANGKKIIGEVYSKLIVKGNFKQLAQQYSNDTGSKNKGGVLPKFGSGRMVKSFEDAAFSLVVVNDFSVPFKTQFGWHIVKLLKTYPVLSFDEMKKEITDRVRKSGRAKLSDKAVLNRLKSEYTINVSASAKKIFEIKDVRSLSNDSLQSTLLTINEKKIKQSDFRSYILNRKHLSTEQLLKNFTDAEVLSYFKENLVKTDEDFASILKEYEDGLLLFELLQQKIWNKSSDTIALKSYFDTHKEKYQGNKLDKIKGRVMNDYQAFLENDWVEKLRSNNTIEIKNKVLKKLIKYYRKES